MEYRLVIEEHPAYLHAKVTAARTPENAVRSLREAYEACVAAGKENLLMEMNLEGPTFDMGSIYAVISQRSGDGRNLRKIAYVENTEELPKGMFAETVARNRGVNVRMFAKLEDAKKWVER